jgi:hypothetical protein
VNLRGSIERRSVGALTRLAALLALAGLGVMAASVVWPRPLPVMLAMSVGHGIGVAAFFVYLLAVVLDVSRSTPGADSSPAPPIERSKPPPPPSAT